MTDSQQLGMNLPDTQPVERVDEFKFEPIKGYPMLNWRGKRPFTSTRYYPAQLKEVHGEEVDGWLNKIYWGDNLQVMSHLLKEFRGKVDLVYIDPPFDSKADYKKSVKLKGDTVISSHSAFEEKQYMDIWTNDEYLQFVYERLILCRELLSDTGSIYLHCDWNKGHYLKIILDEVFGASNFKNHISWKRSTPRGNSSKRYPEITDFILLSSKTNNVIWNSQFTKYAEEYTNKYYNLVDPDNGRRFQPTSLLGHEGVNPVREWKGLSKPWRYPLHRLDELEASNQIYWPPKGEIPRFKRYLDEQKGIPVQSLWDKIFPVNSQAKEDTSYPTQKPEALLDRIIKTSSNPGDLVLDCFMGSGTTQAVSMRLGRRFIGADINLGAIQTTVKRLTHLAESVHTEYAQKTLDCMDEGSHIPTLYTGFEVYNVNHYDVFRNPIQAKDLLIEALEVNPLSKDSLFDGEKDGRMWKVMPVNRITTRADLSELISGFNYKAFEERQSEHPKSPVERITLVCMGHDLDLRAALQAEVKPYEIDIEVIDILRDRQDLQFKRDSEAEVTIEKGELVIQQFYPMNLLGKLSIQQENVEDWREMVESVMIDWNYDGAILEPKTVDIPEENELVQGRYTVPEDAGTIRIKITDVLSESLEKEVQRG